MASNKHDPRGSVWRKWDFQVHTPESHLNNQFGTNWDIYVQGLFRAAISKDLAVLAITDYFTIDGYKKLRQNYIENDTKLNQLFNADEVARIKNITVLANVEFRLRNIVNDSRVNAHVIFSDEVPIRDIEENFLHDLDFTEQAQPQTTAQKRKLKVENLRELGTRLQAEHAEFRGQSPLFIGMKNAVVDDDMILTLLSDTRFKDKFLFCVVADEDLPKMKWNSQAHLTRKVLIQRSDALFSANPSTRQWALGLRHPARPSRRRAENPAAGLDLGQFVESEGRARGVYEAVPRDASQHLSSVQRDREGRHGLALRGRSHQVGLRT